jgi:hypothetical protein
VPGSLVSVGVSFGVEPFVCFGVLSCDDDWPWP